MIKLYLTSGLFKFRRQCFIATFCYCSKTVHPGLLANFIKSRNRIVAQVWKLFLDRDFNLVNSPRQFAKKSCAMSNYIADAIIKVLTTKCFWYFPLELFVANSR